MLGRRSNRHLERGGDCAVTVQGEVAQAFAKSLSNIASNARGRLAQQAVASYSRPEPCSCRALVWPISAGAAPSSASVSSP